VSGDGVQNCLPIGYYDLAQSFATPEWHYLLKEMSLSQVQRQHLICAACPDPVQLPCRQNRQTLKSELDQTALGFQMFDTSQPSNLCVCCALGSSYYFVSDTPEARLIIILVLERFFCVDACVLLDKDRQLLGVHAGHVRQGRLVQGPVQEVHPRMRADTRRSAHTRHVAFRSGF